MKYFQSFLLFVAMLLVSAACQRETIVPESGFQESVTFNVKVPVDAETKAIGDGSQVNRLIFWAFNGETLSMVDTVAVENGGATVVANFLRGIDYTLCFWAETAINKVGPFSMSEDAVVTVDYSAMVNSDRYDCFFATIPDYTAGSITQPIELKRPFAQLNVGISYADTTAAGLKGFHADKSLVKLGFTAPNVLDLKDASLSGQQVCQSNSIIGTWDALVEETDDNQQIVPEKSYARAAFCYVLADGTHETLENVHFEITGYQNNNVLVSPITKDVASVPVYANQQTNILGEILDKNLDAPSSEPTYTVSIAQSIIDNEETRGGAWLYDLGSTFYQNAYEEGDNFIVYFQPVGRHQLKEFYYLDQNQEPVYPQVDSQESTATFTNMPPYNITIYGSFVIPTIEYDFTQIEGFGNWGNSYSQRVVAYDDATVTFASASHQTSIITDRPVTKGGDVSLVLTGETMETMQIEAVTFYCKQWDTKAQTITLYYSMDGGSSWISTNITSNGFKVVAPSLASNTNAVKISFSSTSNQVGISSISYDIELKSN